MHLWFMYLFESRMDANGYINCFECGRPLHESKYKENSCVYSHILEKSRFPKEEGNRFNIEICCPDCHTLYTMKPKSAINQYTKRLKLLKEYGYR